MLFLWLVLITTLGILVKGAVDFKQSGNMVQLLYERTDPLPYNVTNAGVQMAVKLIPFRFLCSYLETDIGGISDLRKKDLGDLFIPLLHCGNRYLKCLHSIILERLKTGGNQYVRLGPIISFSRPPSNIAGDVQQIFCSVAMVSFEVKIGRTMMRMRRAEGDSRGYDIFD
jgi:hypothetical protein